MAPVPLNISPVFRPWRQAGITHLLLDDDVRARLLARPEPEASPPPRPASIPSGERQAQRQPQSIQSAQPSKPMAPPPGIPARPAPYQPPQVSPAPLRETPPDAVQTLPPEQWSAYWQTLLKKTPARPALVWTYPSLSRDLGGAADDAHRNFLRRLLGDMGMPKGSHAFWPLNRYPYEGTDSEQSVDAAMFMGGIAALNPESVILMCGQIPPALGLTDLHPLMPSIVNGRRFVVTPHVDILIREPQRYAQLISFLKSVISGR